VPITIFANFQALFLDSRPEFMENMTDWYLESSKDPIMAVLLGLHGSSLEFLWLRTFFVLERIFQFPVFFIGMYALWKGYKSFYPLLVIYGASTATTVVPCFLFIWNYPTSTVEPEDPSDFSVLHPDQRFNSLAAMFPWVIIPLVMTVDLGWRTAKLIKAATQEDVLKKGQ